MTSTFFKHLWTSAYSIIVVIPRRMEGARSLIMHPYLFLHQHYFISGFISVLISAPAARVRKIHACYWSGMTNCRLIFIMCNGYVEISWLPEEVHVSFLAQLVTVTTRCYGIWAGFVVRRPSIRPSSRFSLKLLGQFVSNCTCGSL